MDLIKEKVEEIAGELIAGLTCYINRESEEIISVYEKDDDFYIEEGDDEDKLAEVLKNPDDYLRVEGMSSQEEFFLMQSYIDNLKNEDFKTTLSEAISNRKPFVKFHEIVDEDVELKKGWTDFKATAFVDLVNDQLLEDE